MDMSTRTEIEPSAQVSVKLPHSLIRLIEKQARHNRLSRSDVIRSMIFANLRSAGMLPTSTPEVA